MNRRIAVVMDALDRWGRPALLWAALASMLVLGLVDYLTGIEVSFAFFYLIPICFVAWFVGRHAGIAFSLASVITWQIANRLAGEAFSHPLISYWNAGTRLGFFVVITFLLAGLKEVLERERTVSRTDFLTGVVNRRAFYDLATREIQRAHRYGHPFIVAYIDLDNFKQVNDRFGHRAGDDLLKIVAQTILANLRSSDVVARLGGDEFAVLLAETDAASAQGALSKLRQRLLEEMARHKWPVTFSIGALTCEAPPPSVEEMIRLADDLMYTVKAAGKNSIHYDRFPARHPAG